MLGRTRDSASQKRKASSTIPSDRQIQRRRCDLCMTSAMNALEAMETGDNNGESDVGLVVSFFRSPVVLARDQRAIFRRALLASEFSDRLRRAPLNMRANVARIFVAARVASRHHAPLLFAEGWRCHAIDHVGAGTHHVTGSYMACLLLKMLQRRRLADPQIRVLRRDASRCTLEEVACVQQTASPRGAVRVIGVAGRACPSQRRAARYFRLHGVAGVRVYDCWRVLEAWSALMTPEQRDFAAALWPSASERVRETLFEGANWLLHWASWSERYVRRPAVPLEIRLAHRLRRDRA